MEWKVSIENHEGKTETRRIKIIWKWQVYRVKEPRLWTLSWTILFLQIIFSFDSFSFPLWTRVPCLPSDLRIIINKELKFQYIFPNPFFLLFPLASQRDLQAFQKWKLSEGKRLPLFAYLQNRWFENRQETRKTCISACFLFWISSNRSNVPITSKDSVPMEITANTSIFSDDSRNR